ncbi:trypsin-like serine peptidase [Ralstonia pseudosolanacearum]
MTPPFSEQEPALIQQGRQTEFTPNQKQRLAALGHKGDTACTGDVTSQVQPTQRVLRNIFGRNEERIASEWRTYLADPATYSANSSTKGKAFAAATAALQDMLSKCLKPASDAPAYSALDVPKRLGFLYVYGGQQCEAMLLSRDRILTARHCWFESKDITQEYQDGRVDFVPAGDSSKRYQVCAAETKALGASGTLEDEQIVLRIAPVSYDLPVVDLFPSHDIAPFVRKADDTSTSTSSVVFTWVAGAALVNPAFKDNLAVGSTACYVQAYDSGKQCFTHMCQTYPGTSGAAMFTQENGTWKLLGMHIGAAKPTADGLYPTSLYRIHTLPLSA